MQKTSNDGFAKTDGITRTTAESGDRTQQQRTTSEGFASSQETNDEKKLLNVEHEGKEREGIA